MNRSLLTVIAFGWLIFAGTMHFIVDVVSQYLRHKRAPGPETTLYYGLNSAFALGQVLLGVGVLWAVSRSDVPRAPLLVVGLVGAVGWFAIVHYFMEYWEPKVAVGVFAALVVAALLGR